MSKLIYIIMGIIIALTIIVVIFVTTLGLGRDTAIGKPRAVVNGREIEVEWIEIVRGFYGDRVVIGIRLYYHGRDYEWYVRDNDFFLVLENGTVIRTKDSTIPFGVNNLRGFTEYKYEFYYDVDCWSRPTKLLYIGEGIKIEIPLKAVPINRYCIDIDANRSYIDASAKTLYLYIKNVENPIQISKVEILGVETITVQNITIDMPEKFITIPIKNPVNKGTKCQVYVYFKTAKSTAQIGPTTIEAR